MNIIEMNIDNLMPYENNPRKNDGAVDAVAASIKEFGFKVPIVVDKDNEIIAGHTRLKAAKKLELKTVPVVVADDLTPEQVKAFRLADNKTAELAGWDFDLLDMEITDISEIDMEQFGFNLDTIAPDSKYMDDGYKEEQNPLSDEELDAYEQNADENFLTRKRVIITFDPEDEDAVKALLGVDGDIKVVYKYEELK